MLKTSILKTIVIFWPVNKAMQGVKNDVGLNESNNINGQKMKGGDFILYA